MKKTNNINLALFMSLLLMITFFPQNQSLLSKQLLSKDSSFNNYGFFCLPLKSDSKDLTPIRLNLNGQVECFTVDGNNCLTDAKYCKEKAMMLFKTKPNQIIQCPSDATKQVDGYAWCKTAAKAFFNNWICPSTTGLNVAIKMNSYSGNVSCLSKTGDACYTDEQAEKACKKANFCTDIELKKKIFNELECGSAKFFDKYGNIGYNAKFNNWCRKAMTAFIDKENFYYPESTGTTVILKFTDKSNPSCLSTDADTCLEYSAKPDETQKKYLSNILDKGLFTTITCGPELKKTKLGITGYETENHWCRKAFTNIGLSLTQLQPVSEMTEKNEQEMPKTLLENKDLLNKLKGQKTENDKELEKKKKEMDTAVSELRDPLECNQLADVYLKQNDENLKLQIDINSEEIRLGNAKVKFFEDRKNLLELEKTALEKLVKEEELKTETNPKLTDKIKLRLSKISDLIKTETASIADAKKSLDDLIKAKTDIENKASKNKSEIKQNKIKYESIMANRDLEKMKLMNDLSQKPILIKPPTSNDSKSKELPKYTSKEVEYTPLLTDDAVKLYVENFKKVSAEMGFDITAQEIDLTPRIPELSIVNYDFQNKDPSSRKTLLNAINLKESNAVANPYKVSVELLQPPFNQEENLTEVIRQKKDLLFFSRPGTQVKPGDYLIIANPLLQKYLKSYDVRFIQPSSGSKQQEVSGGEIIINPSKGLDTFGLWTMMNSNDNDQTPLSDGSLVKLLHIQTGRLLYAQPYIKSSASKREEVSCYTGSKAYIEDESNNNDLFILKIMKSLYSDGVFRVGDSFTLEHYTTGLKLGMGKYLTPRTSQNEVFAFNEEEAKTNSGLSAQWLVTASLSNLDDGEAPVETSPTVQEAPSVDSPPSYAQYSATFTVEQAAKINSPNYDNSKAQNNCSEDKPFCLSSITDNTNPNISGMIMREYLKDIPFEKIGARLASNDKIRIANVITGTYMSFSPIKSLSGSFREQIVGVQNSNDSSIMKYLWKRTAGSPAMNIIELEFENNGKLYKVYSQSGFKESNFGQQQVSAVISSKANNNAEFYLEPIQSVSPDDAFVRIGNLYALKHVNTNCYLTVADYNVTKRNTNGLLESTELKEVYCSKILSYGSVFTITYKQGVNKSEDYLPFTPAKKATESNFIQFMNRLEELQVENEITYAANATVKATLTTKRDQLRLKNAWLFTVNEKPSQSTLTASIKITDSSIFFKSPLRENNYSRLTPYLQTSYSTENVGRISLAGRVVIFQHEKTGAFLNKSGANVIGYLGQNLGNFWKVQGNNSDDLTLMHYITGENLNVDEETDATKRENNRQASRLYTSGVNGYSNSNSQFEFYDESFNKINKISDVTGSSTFMIRFKNRGCFLAFVPKKYDNNYYIPYCMQESKLSNIPKEFFMWNVFRSVDDGEDIKYNQVVEKKILLDKSYNISVKAAFCCNQSGGNGINASTGAAKNHKVVRSNDFLYLKFEYDDYVVQVQEDIFPGFSQFLAFTRKLSTNDAYLKYFRLINVSGGKFLNDGDTVRFVSYATGKCLSSNKIVNLASKNADSKEITEYLVYAAGNNGVCDENSDWIINKKSSKDKKNTDFDQRILYDDDIIITHKNNNNMYLTFINYNDMLGIEYADKVRSTFVVIRNKFDETQSLLKLKFYGVEGVLDINFFRYTVSDGYAATNTKVTNSEMYNLITKFDRTEIASDWMNIIEKDMSSTVTNADDFKSITSIRGAASSSTEFSIVNETKAASIAGQFSNINEIKAVSEPASTLRTILPINNLDTSTTRDFSTINNSPYSVLPNDIKSIESVSAQSGTEFKDITKVGSPNNTEFKVLGERAYVADPKTFNELTTKSLANDKKTFNEPNQVTATADKKAFSELSIRANTQTVGSFGELNKVTNSGNGSFTLLTNNVKTETTGSFGSPITPTARSGDGSFGIVANNAKSGNGSFGEVTRTAPSGEGSFSTIANTTKAETLGSLVALK